MVIVAGDCQGVGVFGTQRRTYFKRRRYRLDAGGKMGHLEVDLFYAIAQTEQLTGLREVLLDALYFLRRRAWTPKEEATNDAGPISPPVKASQERRRWQSHKESRTNRVTPE